jgi:uncharacterized short protein YbdD (DUF466 family)
MRGLRSMVYDRKMELSWSLALPLIQRVMNASVNKSTGYTPAQLMFGNNIDLDRNLLYDSRVQHPDLPIHETMLKLMNMQAEVIAKVHTIQDLVNIKHINRKLSKERNVQGFLPNSMVLWEYPENGMEKDSRPNKFASHFRGPYRTIDTQGSRVQIQNLVTLEVKQVLATQLVPFKYDPAIVDPKMVALHASGEFVVERILYVKGRRNSQRKYLKSELIIGVKWMGYSDHHNTDEPYKNMKHTTKFHEYCRNARPQLLDLIPLDEDRLKTHREDVKARRKDVRRSK